MRKFVWFYVPFFFLVYVHRVSAQNATERSDLEIVSTSVRSSIEDGSFILKHVFSDGSTSSITIVGPLSPRETPKICVKRSVSSEKMTETKELSRDDVRNFVSKRFAGKEVLSNAESGFLAVLVFYKEELASIKHWGMGGSMAINDGNWRKVFYDPSTKVRIETSENGEPIK